MTRKDLIHRKTKQPAKQAANYIITCKNTTYFIK